MPPYSILSPHARAVKENVTMAQKDVNIKIKANSKEATSAIGKVTESLNSFNKKLDTNPVSRLTKSVGFLSVGFKAASAAIQKVGAAVKETTELYEKQAKAEKQLEVAARNNPYLNGSSVEALKDYASHLQSISTVGDEELLPMMAQLASAGRKQGEIQDIMSAALDLSASGMMSLDSAVSALNGSMQGNAGVLGKQIPAVRALTAEQLKQGKAIEIIKEQFAGMSEETTKATGSAQQLKNAIGDLKENLGQGFSAVISPVRQMFTGLISSINGTISEMKKAVRQAKAIKAVRDGTSDGMDSGTLSDVQKTEYKFKASAEAYKHDRENALIESILENGGTRETANAQISEINRYSARYINNENGYVAMYAQAIKEYQEASQREAQARGAYNRAVQAEQEAEEAARRSELEAAYQEANAAIEAKRSALKIDAEARGKSYSDSLYAEELYETAISAYKNMITSAEDYATMQNYDTAKGAESIKNKIKNFAALIPPVTSGSAGTTGRAAAPQKDWFKALSDSLDQVEKEFAARKEVGSYDYEEYLKSFTDAARKGLLDIMVNTDKTTLDKVMENEDARDAYNNLVGQLGMLDKLTGWKAEKEELIKGLDGIKDDVQLILSESIQLQIDQYSGMYQELAELNSTYHLMSEEEEEAYNEKMELLAKQLREAQKAEFMEAVQEKVDLAQRIVSELGTSATQAASMVTEYIENTQSAETANLRKEYEDGVVSYEEYCDKVKELDRQAAQDKYKLAMATWAIQLAQATANIAQGVTKAIAEGGMMGIISGALVSAAGAVNIASIVASKPRPPSFSGGGIVPGNSFSGDRVQANVNSGEMVLNASQQKALWAAANGNGVGGFRQQIIINNTMADRANVSAEADEGMIRVAVTEIVRSEMSRGSFTASMKEADAKSKGVRYL